MENDISRLKLIRHYRTTINDSLEDSAWRSMKKAARKSIEESRSLLKDSGHEDKRLSAILKHELSLLKNDYAEANFYAKLNLSLFIEAIAVLVLSFILVLPAWRLDLIWSIIITTIVVCASCARIVWKMGFATFEYGYEERSPYAIKREALKEAGRKQALDIFNV